MNSDHARRKGVATNNGFPLSGPAYLEAQPAGRAGAVSAPVRAVAQGRGFTIGQRIKVEVSEGRLTIVSAD
jgi:hypothetical protein